MKPLCTIVECDRPVRARGYCASHHQRWRLGIPLDSPIAANARPFMERLWEKVSGDDPLGCWLWTGALTTAGYGSIWRDGKRVYPHRVIYELLIVEIPEGLELDHLCVTPPCVNPWHLEPVTHAVNMRRIYRRSACDAIL